MIKYIFKSPFLFLLLIYGTLFSQQLTPEQIMHLKIVYQPIISPDGSSIAYFLRVPPKDENSTSTSPVELRVFDLSSQRDKLFASSTNRTWNVQWSKDGKFLYFLRNDTKTARTQVFKMPVDGGEAFPITSSPKTIINYKFNPDESCLALICREDLYYNQNSPEEDWIHNEIHFKYQYIYLYNFQDHSLKKISPDTLHIWDMEWSPDGNKIYFQATRIGMTDYSYMFRNLYSVEINTGKFEKIVNHQGKMGKMLPSPDGKYVAFLGAIDLYDPTDGSLLLTSGTGKNLEYKNLTKNFKGTVTDFIWLDSKTLLLDAEVWNETKLFLLDLKKNKIKEFWSGTEVFTRLSFSPRSNVIAFAGSNYSHPAELFTMSLKSKKIKRHTFNNPELKNISFSPQEDFTWRARDGKTIGGILVKPVHFQEGKKYPLVVLVHGGPESAYLKGWNNYYSRWPQILAQKGAFVFMPNYRGSTGHGVKFAEADQGDMMGVDFNDILDGIDALIAKGWIDKSKVGITGGSYGGYASAWAATRWSDRFAVAVMFVGISNQVSKIGMTDTWYENALVHWRGWPYDDNFKKAWDRSPLKYIDNAHTPILILHGDSDKRVPTAQSHELYRALKYKKVPVELYIYPGEGHGNRKYHHQKHYMEVALNWFDKYLFDKK